MFAVVSWLRHKLVLSPQATLVGWWAGVLVLYLQCMGRIQADLAESLILSHSQASLFGNNDGPGHSLVYYYALREGFNPSLADNPAAVGLLRRFIHNGREENSEPTRNRLKLIPRVVNIDEWSAAAPLSKMVGHLQVLWH